MPFACAMPTSDILLPVCAVRWPTFRLPAGRVRESRTRASASCDFTLDIDRDSIARRKCLFKRFVE